MHTIHSWEDLKTMSSLFREIHIALALHISYCTGGDIFFGCWVFPFPFFRGLLSVAQHLGSPAPDMRYSEVQCHRRPQVDSQTQGMHTTDPDDDDCHLFFFFFFLLMIIVHLFLLSWFYFLISVLSLSLLPLYTMIVVPFWTASGAAHFEVAAGLMADQWLEQSIWRSSQAHVSWPSASWPCWVSGMGIFL